MAKDKGEGKMSLIKAIFLVASIVTTLSGVFDTSTVQAAKKVIAVVDVVNQTNYTEGSTAATQFQGEVTSRLVQSGAFGVVERAQLNYVLRELNLHQTGLIEGQTAIALGNKVGAEYTFIANLIELNAGIVDHFAYNALNGRVAFNCKVVDNKTGYVKISEVVKGSQSQHIGPKDRPQASQINNLLAGAVREAAKSIADKIYEFGSAVTATVMRVNGDKAYVNLSTEQGARIGGLYVAFKEGQPLIDPASGDVIGVEEEELGFLKVIEVKGNYCVMQIKKGEGKIKAGCKIKRYIKR